MGHSLTEARSNNTHCSCTKQWHLSEKMISILPPRLFMRDGNQRSGILWLLSLQSPCQQHLNKMHLLTSKCMASLDGAEHACVFASGLATSTTITHLLNAGDHIISMDDVYGGTNRYFRKVASRMNIETTFVDATNP